MLLFQIDLNDYGLDSKFFRFFHLITDWSREGSWSATNFTYLSLRSPFGENFYFSTHVCWDRNFSCHFDLGSHQDSGSQSSAFTTSHHCPFQKEAVLTFMSAPSLHYPSNLWSSLNFCFSVDYYFFYIDSQVLERYDRRVPPYSVFHFCLKEKVVPAGRPTDDSRGIPSGTFSDLEENCKEKSFSISEPLLFSFSF